MNNSTVASAAYTIQQNQAAPPTYSSPISLTKTATVNAIAASSCMCNSNVPGPHSFPTRRSSDLAPPGGTYVGSQTVTLSTVTSGATMYYTTDGSTPTAASSVYTTPILLTKTTTVRTMAAASGMNNSTVSSAVYTLQAVPPTFSPPTGTYVGSQTVTLSTVTSGATIHYTTDGS